MTSTSMPVPSHDQDDRFEIGSVLPFPLRVVLAVIGLGCCVLVLWELGRGLWPPSFLTLFFGIIVLGGLFVGLSLMLFAIAVPDTRWVIEPRAITVTVQLGGRHRVKRFETEDFEWGQVNARSSDSGPDTWGLRLKLNERAKPALAELDLVGGLRLISLLDRAPFFARRTPFENGILHSADFPRKAAAERALALLGVDEPY